MGPIDRTGQIEASAVARVSGDDGRGRRDSCGTVPWEAILDLLKAAEVEADGAVSSAVHLGLAIAALSCALGVGVEVFRSSRAAWIAARYGPEAVGLLQNIAAFLGPVGATFVWGSVCPVCKHRCRMRIAAAVWGSDMAIMDAHTIVGSVGHLNALDDPSAVFWFKRSRTRRRIVALSLLTLGACFLAGTCGFWAVTALSNRSLGDWMALRICWLSHTAGVVGSAPVGITLFTACVGIWAAAQISRRGWLSSSTWTLWCRRC
mmetsp:Transcript_2875/g.9398  ORF Transcript_2875/g.9398 Transcript_2875/m.9398 type:complete len:262 (-) Transcript_2875:457-1242(-)